MAEHPLIASIRADPESDEHRLAFAKACDATDPARAEFIRLQCRLANEQERPNSAAIPKVDQERIQELLDEHSGDWVGPDSADIPYPDFTRGFLEEIEVNPDITPEAMERLLDLHPIRTVAFTDDAMEDQPDRIASHLKSFADSPVMARIQNLKSEEAEIGCEGWRALLSSPHLSGLRGLQISDHDSNVEVAAVISDAPASGLKRIRFAGQMSASLGDQGVKHLANSANLVGLTELDLWNCQCGAPAAKAIADSPYLHNLQRLHFGGGNYSKNSIGSEGAQALASGAHLHQLRILNLDFNNLTDEGGSSIPESESLPLLEHLSMQANALTNITIRCFMSAHLRLPNLRTLDLSHNDIDGGGLEFFAGCKLLAKLELLSLYHNNIGPSGVYELCQSDKASALKVLDLTQNPLGTESSKVVDALIQSPHLQELEELYMQRCDLEESDRVRLRQHFGTRVRS